MKSLSIKTSTGVYIPVLTSDAGMSMTVANWQETGVEIAAYALSSLLMKPGFDVLMTLPDLASWVGWKGRLVLDATLSQQDVNGLYTVKSIYDGHRTSVSIHQIIQLVLQLKPDIVILPEIDDTLRASVFQSLPETIFPMFPFTALPEEHEVHRAFGIFFSGHEEACSLISTEKDKLYYVSGSFDLSTMLKLKKQGFHFIQSDLPAQRGVLGQIDTREGSISIQDPSLAMQFQVLDEACDCITCREGWTRAYLHHLYEHTPQLCQRFLVQHNVHDCLNSLSKMGVS